MIKSLVLLPAKDWSFKNRHLRLVSEKYHFSQRYAGSLECLLGLKLRYLDLNLSDLDFKCVLSNSATSRQR